MVTFCAGGWREKRGYFAEAVTCILVQEPFFKKNFQDVGLQLFLERGSCKGFFCEMFKFL